MLLYYIIYLIYGIPSAVLNLLLIICIRKNKEFRENSFYRTYSFVLFVYLFTYMNNHITIKIRELLFIAPIYNGISQKFIPFRFFFTTQFATFHIQQWALILMHLNRFTSVWLPITHSQIWTSFNFRIAAISAFLFGYGCCYENFFVTGYYATSPAGLSFNPTKTVQIVPISLWFEKTFCHVYPCISVLINATIFAKLFYLRATKGKRITSQKSVETNLLLICLGSLFSQLAVMCYLDFAPTMATQQATFLALNLVTDGSTLSEAYIGLTLNGTLRRKFIQWLPMNKIQSKTPSIIVHRHVCSDT